MPHRIERHHCRQLPHPSQQVPIHPSARGAIRLHHAPGELRPIRAHQPHEIDRRVPHHRVTPVDHPQQVAVFIVDEQVFCGQIAVYQRRRKIPGPLVGQVLAPPAPHAIELIQPQLAPQGRQHSIA